MIRILKDERYTGKMISHKRETDGVNTGKMRALPPEEWIVVPNTHEAIISQELFDLAKASRTTRIKTVNKNTAGNRADNLFVCGYCGRKLQKSYGSLVHLFCLKAGVSSDSPCAGIHEPIERLQDSVLTIVNAMARVLVDRVVEVKADTDHERLVTQKRITEMQTKLKRLQAGKIELYEEYRHGKISREKFMAIQKKRQLECDNLNAALANLEEKLGMLEQKAQRMETLASDAKDARLLDNYQPDVIRRLIKRIRVYGECRIEIDLQANDEFIIEILEKVMPKAG